jgi:hypothetical protein
MSLNNVNLPTFLYPLFFKNNLLSINEKMKETELFYDKFIESLGGNGKHVIFLVKDKENKFISDKLMVFLQDLLAACHLTMGDVALINFEQKLPITLTNISFQFEPEKVLSFGISANELNLAGESTLFEVQKINDVDYLFCPPIEAIQSSVAFKKKLWKNLQELFNLTKA